MVVRMRHTRSHTANRRSHHALAVSVKTLCKECGSPCMPHTVCKVCGKYKGRQVVDVHARLAKREKKQKEKQATSNK